MIIKRLKQIGLLMTLLAATMTLHAIPAHRHPVTIQQPDGSHVTIQLHGNEWQHFSTTADGYTVVKNDQGFYVYAQCEDGMLTATEIVAHDAENRTASEQAFVAQTAKYLKPSMPESTRLTKQQVEQHEAQKLVARRAQANGRRAAQYDYSKFRGLIILVEWKDKSFSREDYKDIATDMVNKVNYTGYDNVKCTGSVYDYFVDNSLGKFKPQFDVIGPVKLNNYTQYSYGADDYAYLRITKAVIDAVDSQVNFKDYDGDGDGVVDLVFFVFAGNGSNFAGNDERLWWPHRASLYDINNRRDIKKDNVRLFDYASSVELYGYTSRPATIEIDGIGTICHEFSHVLGLPDFYDTNYDKDGMEESNHPGDWSVMAGGSYMNTGRTPAGFSIYERWAVGFCDEDPELLTGKGDYTLPPLSDTQAKGYRINTPVNNEYFLLENRQKTKFKWDSQLPGSGMLVYRVDRTKSSVWDMSSNEVNANPNHMFYELIRANGPHRRWNSSYKAYEYYASPQDAFPNNNKTSLTNTTTPANLKTWSGQENALGLLDIKLTNDNNITFTVTDYQTDGIQLITQGPQVSNGLQSPNAPCYNLQGQRVATGYQGLVIMNGKKLLKK